MVGRPNKQKHRLKNINGIIHTYIYIYLFIYLFLCFLLFIFNYIYNYIYFYIYIYLYVGISPMISNDNLIMISLVELHGATSSRQVAAVSSMWPLKLEAV